VQLLLISVDNAQVFSVPVEEQRLKEMSEQQFGERGRVQQNRICSDIMARTGIRT